MKSPLDYTIDRAIKVTVARFRPTFQTPTGITRPKTRTMGVEEARELTVLVEILDHGFRWHGSWGSTQFAIREELRRLAAERGLLVLLDQSNYALPDGTAPTTGVTNEQAHNRA